MPPCYREASSARGAPRLDERTQLSASLVERWAGTVYEEAGEGTYWLAREDGLLEAVDAFGPRLLVEWADTEQTVTPQTVEEVTLNRERAARRARGRVRRYAVRNGCTRLGTLTYAVAQSDRRLVVRQVQQWERRVRERFGRVPLVWALELHPGGHGFHVHFALGGPRKLPKVQLGELWGHGFVDIRKVRTGRGGREDARGAARYVGKYVGKAFDAGLGSGEHAYEVAQGFQPVARSVTGTDPGTVRLRIMAAMGGEVPSYEWSSEGLEDWRGPPVGFLSFG